MHRLMAVSSAMRARAAGRRLMSRRHLSAISMSESFLPLDTFVNRHCGSSPDEIQTMLDVVGVNHLEGLSEQCVPKDIYLQRLLKVWPGRFAAPDMPIVYADRVVVGLPSRCRPPKAKPRRWHNCIGSCPGIRSSGAISDADTMAPSRPVPCVAPSLCPDARLAHHAVQVSSCGTSSKTRLGTRPTRRTRRRSRR